MPTLPDRLLARVATALSPRVDAAPVAPDLRADDSSGATVVNTLSGLGGARDSGAMARPNLQRDYLTQEELIALMRGSVYRRIVELKPRWATAKGFTLTDSTNEERPLKAGLKRIQVDQVVRRADTWARALGESRVLLVTDDPAPLSEPLDPRRVKRLHRLEVLDRREFSPVAYNSDVAAGVLGEPSAYRLHPYRPGVQRSDHVHASRLLRFYGDDLPPSEIGYNFASSSSYGADAVGQTLWDGIRHLAQTGAGGARIAQELTVAVFKLASQGGVAGDQRAALLSRLSALNMMKSIANAIWLSPNESFERVAANPTGFADLSNHARLELALLTGYPLTLLFGIAPGGLATDGESWQEAWRADVSSYQEERYREPIERIVEVLYHSEQGGPPDQWGVEFAPLGTLTDKERAEIRLVHTQADAIAVQDGMLTTEEARSRYTQPGGFALELQPVTERQARTAPVVDPAIEASARALVERGLQTGAVAAPVVEAPVVEGAAAPEAEPAAGQGSTAPPTDIALNGAQVQSANAILDKVIARTMPPELGAYQLEKFFGFDPAVAGRMIALALEQPAPVAPQLDATEGACWIGIPLPDAARAAWEAARAAVATATGPLVAGGDAPHTTVLYLGALAPADLAEVEAAVQDVATRYAPSTLHAEAVTVFPAGTDGTPVVLAVRRGWTLDSLHTELLARMAHLVSQRQHVPYRAHVTLGYVPTLSSEQAAAALEVVVPELEWTAARLEIWYGSARMAVVPLTGRADSSGGRTP